jgi:formamidopyrimidine-DNA glycosylase
VQTVVDTLRPRLLGRQILDIPTLRPDILTPPGFDLSAHLAGRFVIDLARRGKRIVFTLDDKNRFYIHLGMTGRLTMETTDTPVEKHTHLIMIFEGRIGEKGRGQKAALRSEAQARREGRKKKNSGRSSDPNSAFCLQPSALHSSLRFRDPRRFGGIWWLGKNAPAGDMGPEPLLIRPAQLAHRLARTHRAIKNVLLDQTVLAGIGNIYADESLFLAKLHPLIPADELRDDQVRRLNRAIKLTLRRALRHRGSTLRDYVDADGVKGTYQQLHRVYDRAGKPCRDCKAPIERIVLGGRSTHFCPTCQAPKAC